MSYSPEHEQFIAMVAKMRLAQIDYVSAKKRNYTDESKRVRMLRAQNDVDAVIQNYNKVKASGQAELFGNMENSKS